MMPGKKKPSRRISAAKARKILDDGAIRGTPLTEKQRKMFGAASRKKSKY